MKPFSSQKFHWGKAVAEEVYAPDWGSVPSDMPSIILASVHTLRNIMDLLDAKCLVERAMYHRPDWNLAQRGHARYIVSPYSIVRMDRTSSSGKDRGGGVCIYMQHQNPTPKSAPQTWRSCLWHWAPSTSWRIPLMVIGFVYNTSSSNAKAVVELVADTANYYGWFQQLQTQLCSDLFSSVCGRSHKELIFWTWRMPMYIYKTHWCTKTGDSFTGVIYKHYFHTDYKLCPHPVEQMIVSCKLWTNLQVLQSSHRLKYGSQVWCFFCHSPLCRLQLSIQHNAMSPDDQETSASWHPSTHPLHTQFPQQQTTVRIDTVTPSTIITSTGAPWAVSSFPSVTPSTQVSVSDLHTLLCKG